MKGQVVAKPVIKENYQDMVARAGAKVLSGLDVTDHRLGHETAMFLSKTCNEADDRIEQMTALSGDNNDAPLDQRVEGP